MPDYRLYCLGGTGHIETAHDIIAGNDEDAIMIARSKKLTVKRELWERGLLVVKIPAHKAQSRPSGLSRFGIVSRQHTACG